jgi:hypothetical protein
VETQAEKDARLLRKAQEEEAAVDAELAALAAEDSDGDSS